MSMDIDIAYADSMTRVQDTGAGRGAKVVIAGASVAAHLPGMVATNSLITPITGINREL